MTDSVNAGCPMTGSAVTDVQSRYVYDQREQYVGFCSEACRETFKEAVAPVVENSPPDINLRGMDLARSGANTNETILTPAAVKSRGIKKLFTVVFPGDARGMEAQPLVSGMLTMPDGTVRDVAFCATMSNHVWAIDLADNTILWVRQLGRPIKVTKDIDMFGINDHAGIYSTPVIQDGFIYVCAWISPDGTVAKAQHWLFALRITDGATANTPLSLETATYNAGGGLPIQKFVSAQRKQRAALTFTGGAVHIPFGTIAESSSTARGWLIAVDVGKWAVSATWCSTVSGSGGGIWHSGGGLAVNSKGEIFLITGNGDFNGQDNLSNSVLKLAYDGTSYTKLGHWTPYTDKARTAKADGGMTMGVSLKVEGEMSESLARIWQETKEKFAPLFESLEGMSSNVHLPKLLAHHGVPMEAMMAMGVWGDQDLGSGAPTLSADEKTLLASGKDGILYPVNAETLGDTTLEDLLPANVARNFAKLRSAPVWYTGYPGPSLSAAPTDVQTLNTYYGNVSHHMHGSPLRWVSDTYGEMHFCGGENGALRAWRLNEDGSSTFLGQTTETASPQSKVPLGGMPGWQFCLSADGGKDAMVWGLLPAGDANSSLTPGRLLACEVSTLYGGVIGALWDSWNWGAGCAFLMPKFNRPVVFRGKLLVPTYDGTMDVYGLA